MLFVSPCVAHAQAWSGLISSNRAADWSQAGIPGGLPDANWPICQTISAYTGSGATIQTALSKCHSSNPNGGVVVLGTGTFNLSSGVLFPGGHLAVRGQGANNTIIVFTGAASGCNGQGGFFCANGDGTYRGNPSNVVHNWTAGYAKGTTQITLDSVSSIVAGQSILVLNQCDTGFSGTNCTTGAPIDNLGYFICATPWTSAGVGCNINGESADGPAWRSGPAWQQEYVLVTAINQGGCGATCVTISSPLHHPNWSAAQSPQAIVIQPVIQVGVENMTIDGSSDFGSVGAPANQAVGWNNAYQAWVSGVRTINGGGRATGAGGCFNCVWQNNYFYGNPAVYGDNAGVMINGGGYNLIVNNICQQVHLCLLNDGPDDAYVFAYNYAVDMFDGSTDLLGNGVDSHSGPANDFALVEGNVITKTNDDIDHGGHVNMTKFRNLITGWESCANGQCGTVTAKATQVSSIITGYASRYLAFVGNVLGTPGYHTIYKDTQTFGSKAIYESGVGYGSQPADPLSVSTSLYWGNWDVVTGATRWCGNPSDIGWTITCASTSEVPTSAATYPNAVPTVGDTGAGQPTLPASFIYSSKPAWFGSVPWPPIGPDVSNGNVGQCSGALNVKGQFNGMAALTNAQCGNHGITPSAWGGHVNAIPAMNCFLNVMRGAPDGTGGPLAFDANTCYGSSGSGTPPPVSPTNLTAIVN